MKSDFYVYEWFNVDSNEVFYVGKGRRNRYLNTSMRNQYFKNYYNKHNCDVRKVKVDLKEDEAFKLEKESIEKYRKLSQCQCNITDGGEGSTFPEGTWNYYYRKFCMFYLHNEHLIMQNADDYEPESLKEKTLNEIKELYENFIEERENVFWFNSLDVFDENGNLNIGWECFED